MKLSVKKTLVGVAATAAAATMVVVLPTSSAHAINRVNCTSNDFLQIWQGDGGWGDPDLCFANAGTLGNPYNTDPNDDAAIYGVDMIATGNNAATIWFQQHIGGPIKQEYRSKRSLLHIGTIHKVTAIKIH